MDRYLVVWNLILNVYVELVINVLQSQTIQFMLIMKMELYVSWSSFTLLNWRKSICGQLWATQSVGGRRMFRLSLLTYNLSGIFKYSFIRQLIKLHFRRSSFIWLNSNYTIPLTRSMIRLYPGSIWSKPVLSQLWEKSVLDRFDKIEYIRIVFFVNFIVIGNYPEAGYCVQA